MFWSQFVSVCFGIKLFFSFKIHCLQLLQLFQTRDGPIFFIVTLVYTCRAFFAISSENIYPLYCFDHSSSQSVSEWNSFPPLKYIVYKCYYCFRPGMGHFFFHRHTCLHLSRFFCCIIKKYLSYILFWSQFVSVCFGMKFFSAFKIHCLQLLQLFQTRDGPFFSSSHLSTLVALFLLYHQKIFIPYIVLFWSQFVSVCFRMKFFSSFKIHCLQMLQLFQTRDGPFFFSSSHLSTLVALFLLYHQKILSHILFWSHLFVSYILFWSQFVSVFRNEILFLL